MKFCPFCGNMLDDQITTCPYCGRSEVNVQPVPAEYAYEQPAAPVQQPVYYAPQPYAGYDEQVTGVPVYDHAQMNDNSYCYAPQTTAPQKRIKWWMIALPIVLVVAIAVMLLWNPLMLRLNPMGVLAKAIASAGEDLADRAKGSPLVMMRQVLDEKGNYTVDANMTANGDALGGTAMEVDLALYWNSELYRRQMDFRMEYSGEYLDMRLYADTESMAISSDRILDGKFYGITYETFSKDLRGNALFATMDEDTLSMLEDAVQYIQDANEAMADQEPLSEAYADAIIAFVTELEPVLDSEKRQLDGKERKTDSISFTVSYKRLSDLAEQLLEIAEDDDALRSMIEADTQIEGYNVWDAYIGEIEYIVDVLNDIDGDIVLTFYLYKNDLVGFAVDTEPEYDGEQIGLHMVFDLGTAPASNDICLSMIAVSEDGEEAAFELTISTQKDDVSYTETFLLSVDIPDEDTVNAEFSYEWETESGDLEMTLVGPEDVEFSVNIMLKQTDGGFELEVEDIVGLTEAITGESYYADMEMDVALEVTKGAQIDVPVYKNIDQWNMEDMLNIMSKMQNFG